MTGTSLDEVVPDSGAGADSGEDFDYFYASLGEDVAPPPPVTTGRGMFDREVDFLREALREAFPDPSAPLSRGGVGWAEHAGEDLVELAPRVTCRNASTCCRRAISSSAKCGRSCCWPSRPRRGRSRCGAPPRAPRPGDQSTQWPQAHFLSPLHPVLDWAVDRALTRLGRNQVPVATAAVDAPTVIALGT